MKLQELATHLSADIIGDATLDLAAVASLDTASEQDVSFVLEQKYVDQAKSSQAKALVVFKEIETDKTQLIVKNPRKAMADTIAFFATEPSALQHSIHDTAIIDASSVIESPVSIGPHVVIGPNTVIKKNTQILANVSIGKNSSIGESCFIYSNVSIYDDIHIGSRVIIDSGTVVGSAGFGLYQEKGEWVRVPHIGTVIIEDDVEIGANCSIDRACLDSTVIGKGTKLDNMIHVAHNVRFGSHCAVAAQSVFSGGQQLGNHVMIGGHAAVHASVGDNCVVYAKAGVTRDVKAGEIVSGFPAWDHRLEMKKEAFIRKQIKGK